MFLNCHTYYSLKYGTLSPTQLVETAAQLGIKTLTLTDINNTSCSHTFVTACKKHGIKPVLGIEFREDPEREVLPDGHPGVHKELYYIGIAKNREGGITKLRENEYVGIRPTEVNHLFSSYLKDHQEKLVVLSPISFLDDDGFRIHKLLRCIDLNIIIGNLKPEHCANASERFYQEEELRTLFERYPRIIENTEKLLASCHVELPSSFLNNRQTFTGTKHDDMTLLNKLAINGCKRRYGDRNRKAMQRTLRELKVIDELGFSPYFLITWDIIRYAQTAGYHHVGRGSGANSIVAYNLFITEFAPRF